MVKNSFGKRRKLDIASDCCFHDRLFFFSHDEQEFQESRTPCELDNEHEQIIMLLNVMSNLLY